ncbi:hypothetical protein AN641_00250 [Candidatus Epulonipiscioides gigas]|nr:hypothetical protein AN641_00250 [Epulopiscium sp. SCG-C07WGA-EpuloA2]
MDILSYITFPKETIIGTSLSNKIFSENEELSISEIKFLETHMQNAYLTNVLNSDNVNIRPVMAYDSIYVINVDVDEQENASRIAQLIVRAISFPCIVQLYCEEEFMLALGLRNTTQVKEFICTPWLDFSEIEDIEELDYKIADFLVEIEFSKLSSSNFRAFYQDLINSILRFSLNLLLPSDLNSTDMELIKNSLAEISDLNAKLDELHLELSQEKQFGRKSQLNKQIAELEEDLNELLSDLCDG